MFFVSTPRVEEAQGKYPSGADLVMEVVSGGREDRKRDLVTKRRDYARANIPEYWIVDPQDPSGKFANKADAPDPIDSETKQLDADTMETFGCKSGS